MTIRDEIREVFIAKEGKRGKLGLRCAQVAEELPRLSKDQVKNALKQTRVKGFLGSVIDDDGKTWYFLHHERVVQCRPKEKREPKQEPDAHPLEVAMGGWSEDGMFDGEQVEIVFTFRGKMLGLAHEACIDARNKESGQFGTGA